MQSFPVLRRSCYLLARRIRLISFTTKINRSWDKRQTGEAFTSEVRKPKLNQLYRCKAGFSWCKAPYESTNDWWTHPIPELSVAARRGDALLSGIGIDSIPPWVGWGFWSYSRAVPILFCFHLHGHWERDEHRTLELKCEHTALYRWRIWGPEEEETEAAG